MSEYLDHRTLYRLPWSLSDNPIVWLEPTAKCNLACDGCYRANVNSHKSLLEVDADLDVFARYRNFDTVSIAGGDPLTHPHVVDIVRRVAERGYKPILNTNGLALNESMLADLKRAGLKGVTFHIDSRQNRPGWKDKTEQQTNDLRLHYAKMVASVGDLLCSFNATVYEGTLKDIPDIVDWAQQHIDIVHSLIFICYREAVLEQYDYYAGGKKIDPEQLVYTTDEVKERSDISAREVVETLRHRHPDFAPCAYLNGTEQADSFKWLITSRIATKDRIYGYMGPKMMELAQSAHHAVTGRYFAYSSPRSLRRGKSLLLGWPLDAQLRRAAKRTLLDPRALVQPLHVQSIAIIQPIDIMADGRQNMCDGCPDVTVHEGKIVWSCRLEECLHYGQFIRSVPKVLDTDQPQTDDDVGVAASNGNGKSQAQLKSELGLRLRTPQEPQR